MDAFRLDNVRQRIAKLGDLWKPLLEKKNLADLERFFKRK
jgi:hypothetical protein